MYGKVIENISNKFKVEIDGKIEVLNSRGKLKDKSIVVGDNVKVNEDNQVIEEILPRKTYIKRPKIANVEQIVFVQSCKNPKPDYLMLDKMLCYANFLGLDIIIVFNKIDLDKKKEYLEYKQIYEKIRYETFELDSKSDDEKTLLELKRLKNKISGKTNIFAGNSGVGKSTIINKIFGTSLQLEGDISKKNKRGKNTTTSVRLYKLEDTYIADSPGFSTFNIDEIPYKELKDHFIEFSKIKCEYDDCSHINESECNIKKAVKNNQIFIQRYNNYCKIYEELKKEQLRW